MIVVKNFTVINIFIGLLRNIWLVGLADAWIVRYVEEHVQRTGVAIETQGFTLVTSGRKRESLMVLC